MNLQRAVFVILFAYSFLLSANIRYFRNIIIASNPKILYSKGIITKNEIKNKNVVKRILKKRALYKCTYNKNGNIEKIAFLTKKGKQTTQISISYNGRNISSIKFLNAKGKPVDKGPKKFAIYQFTKKRGKLIITKLKAKQVKTKLKKKSLFFDFNINTDATKPCKGGT